MPADLEVVEVVNRAVRVEQQHGAALADRLHEPEHAVNVEADAERLDGRDLLCPVVAALLATDVQLDAADQFLQLARLVGDVDGQPPLFHHATAFYRSFPGRTRPTGSGEGGGWPLAPTLPATASSAGRAWRATFLLPRSFAR